MIIVRILCLIYFCYYSALIGVDENNKEESSISQIIKQYYALNDYSDDLLKNLKKITGDKLGIEELKKEEKFNDSIDKLLLCDKLTNLESLCLSNIPLSDQYVTSLCNNKALLKLNSIDLSNTGIKLDHLRMIKDSENIGKIQEFYTVHPNYGIPVSFVDIRVDRPTLLPEDLIKLKSNFCFINGKFIKFYGRDKEEEGIKQIKVLVNEEVYTDVPSPTYSEILDLEKKFCKLDIQDSSTDFSVQNFKNLLEILDKMYSRSE